MRNIKIIILATILSTVNTGLLASDGLKIVPLIKLIVEPQKFDNNRVSAVGVYKFDIDSSTLYLTKEHFIADIFDTSISVELPKNFKLVDLPSLEKLNGKYVQITGTFDADEKGYMGLNQGTLKEVEKISFYAK